ncbi:MAG: class I adenylate cyclase, partial [Smithellaceae bacterium]
AVDQSEFYGAALWQLNKSLTHPLKSIIKMLLLKMFLEAPEDELMSNKFKRCVHEAHLRQTTLDPSLYTMQEVLDYYSNRIRPDYFDFIKKCFYLRYEMKMLTGAQTLKEEIAADVFRKFKLEREEIYSLNEFDTWPLWEQIQFGGLMFEFVTDIYRNIVTLQKGITGDIDPRDLTIIGRKLSSSMDAKSFKLPPLHISTENTTLPMFTFSHIDGLWQVQAQDLREEPIIGSEDIVFCLAYLVWNGIFDPSQIRMQPNQTSVTIQEIINLGKTIQDVFGVYDIASVHFNRFLEEEKIDKILIVISFEEADFTMDIRDVCVLYKNNWEEIFVRRFPTLDRMKYFLQKAAKMSSRMESHYYIQRNNKYYEKIIERTKNMIAQIFMGR